MKQMQLYRFILGLSWIYQGLFPKLLTIAPIEKAITATLGYGDKASELITQTAGAGEVVFGLLLLVFYRNITLIRLNILLLVGLLLYIATVIPVYLIEAFNPVTTNIPLIIISLGLIREIDRAKNPYNG